MPVIAGKLWAGVLIGTGFAVAASSGMSMLALLLPMSALALSFGVILLARDRMTAGASLVLGLIPAMALTCAVVSFASHHRRTFDDARLSFPGARLELRELRQLEVAGGASYSVRNEAAPSVSVQLPSRTPTVADFRAALRTQGWDLHFGYCGTAGGLWNSGPPISIRLVRAQVAPP